MPLPKVASTSLQPLRMRRRVAGHGGVAPPQPVTTQLNVAMQPQDQANWCWAAVSVSVKLFYSPGASITQCEQATMQLGVGSCCSDPVPVACDVPWFLDRALSGLNSLAGTNNGALPFARLATQLGILRPLGCRIAWSGGGGHFVLIDGCTSTGAAQSVTVKDPLYGTSVVPYNTFATAYQGSGTWTTSYFTQP